MGLTKALNDTRGFSLLELLIASSLLLISTLTIFQIFVTAYKATGRIKSQSIAALISQRRMEQVRAWAMRKDDGVRYNYCRYWQSASDTSPYTGALTADPDFPEFEVAISNSKVSVHSPSSNFAAPYRYPIEDSLRLVKIEVRWMQGLQSMSYVYYSYVGEPTRKLVSVTVAPDTAQSLTKGDTLAFSAAGFDANNEAIPDLRYRWYVLPKSANGAVLVTGKTATATFTATTCKYTAPGGTKTEVPGGSCKVRLRARSAGAEQWGYSDDITVDP